MGKIDIFCNGFVTFCKSCVTRNVRLRFVTHCRM